MIEETCKKKNNILHEITTNDWTTPTYEQGYQIFDYKHQKQVKINLKGAKQVQNACMVLEAIEILQNKGYTITKKAIQTGLKNVVHKARFEVIGKHPTMIFDGGHNEAAICNLKGTIKQYYEKDKKVYILSILQTKDYKTIIRELIEDKEAILIFTDGTKVQDEVKCYVKKEVLYKEAQKYRKDNLLVDSLENALQKCKTDYQDRVIFIIGIFYTYK